MDSDMEKEGKLKMVGQPTSELSSLGVGWFGPSQGAPVVGDAERRAAWRGVAELSPSAHDETIAPLAGFWQPSH